MKNSQQRWTLTSFHALIVIDHGVSRIFIARPTIFDCGGVTI